MKKFSESPVRQGVAVEHFLLKISPLSAIHVYLNNKFEGFSNLTGKKLSKMTSSLGRVGGDRPIHQVVSRSLLTT